LIKNSPELLKERELKHKEVLETYKTTLTAAFALFVAYALNVIPDGFTLTELLGAIAILATIPVIAKVFEKYGFERIRKDIKKLGGKV
jgi:prepilin-type N-terminal cleavage/methylation domain-containing protein